LGLKDVRLVIVDVDGVLTDGTLSLSDEGVETKHFNVRDWTGIAFLERAGIRTAIVSGRASNAVELRARETGVTEVHLGAKDKLPVVRELMQRLALGPEEVAYIGDDVLDIPVARAVGFSVAVADAHEELKAHCDLVTKSPGGKGAVRELAEVILKTQDKWNTIMKRYLGTEDARIARPSPRPLSPPEVLRRNREQE
jgi:3-deoxy-D-manno-octulosonate 8-phosphate phosphatase (KDO 8-P phosphatase)